MLDYAKALGIILVVMGHYAWYSGNAYNIDGSWIVAHFVTLFHMPLFFFISGMLYSRVEFKMEISKIFKSLIVPYLLFSFLGMGVFLFLSGGKGASRYLFNIFTFGDAYGYYSCNVLTGPLWYCGAIAILRLCEHFVTRSLRIVLVVFGCALLYVGNVLPLRLDSMLVGYVFFSVGTALRDKIMFLLEANFKVRFLVLAIVMLLLCGCWIFSVDLSVVPNFSINAMRFGKYPISFLISGFAGSFMVLLLSSLIKYKSNVVLTISKGTIVILGLHQIFLMAIPKALCASNFLALMVISLAVMLACYIAIIILSRFAPIFLGGRSSR